LNDPQLFARIIDVTYPVYAAFERGPLQALYQRVARSIRAVDPHRILFLETSMGSNMGVYSAIVPVELEGQRDPQQAYAPHGYDLVVDTPDIAASSPERVKLIFTRHKETAQRQDWPMLVGEWGAYDCLPGTLPAAQTVVNLFEQLLCSETYWAYETNIQKATCFPALWRPYPERVAGVLQNCRCDWQARNFTCSWQEDPAVAVPSCIYLPRWLTDSAGQVSLTPTGKGFTLEPAGDTGTWVCISPTGQGGSRSLFAQG
jgi:endoglycosylceramidase